MSEKEKPKTCMACKFTDFCIIFYNMYPIKHWVGKDLHRKITRMVAKKCQFYKEGSEEMAILVEMMDVLKDEH